MGVFCGPMKHETRPTPETDALIERMSDEGLDLYDREDELKDHARKLERERDELREAIAEFCKKHDWACDEWKRQPHIARLFNLNKKP